MTPDYSAPFGGKWSTDMDAAPHDGKSFLGRLRGTNRSFAVHWGCETQKWYRTQEGDSNPVDICEWITFKDFADTRHCVWNGGENCNAKMSGS